MPIPLDLRGRPTSVKVHVSTDAGVDVTWSDGHASHYDFAYLREECPCAMCNEERNKKKTEIQGKSAELGSSLLPMFKPKMKALAAHAVGNYALGIDFNDGHSTGIYSFDYLRTICQCEACAKEYRTPVTESTDE